MNRAILMGLLLLLLPGCGPRGAPADRDTVTVRLYRHHDAWCFDRFQDGLVRRPAIEGDASVIDALAAAIPNAAAGFDLCVTFPSGAQAERWQRVGGDAGAETVTYARQSDGARLAFRRGVLSAPDREPPEAFGLSAHPRR